MTRIIDISPISFHEKILHSETPVVVEFFSHSCPHCIRFGPVYQELSKILTKEAGFFRIDVLLSDESRELAHSRGVHTVPTIEVFYRGRVIGSLTGYHHIKKVLGAVKESLARKMSILVREPPCMSLKRDMRRRKKSSCLWKIVRFVGVKKQDSLTRTGGS